MSSCHGLREDDRHDEYLRLLVRLSFGCAGLLEGEPQEALKGFQEVISMEGEQGEWYVSCTVASSHYMLCISSLFAAT